ncbi:MAG: hypothetical protein FRX48_02028 [Lasallia pustulata]|uniref:Uncharacterized protein n=1 Tax=Lasallia pustulata TaxID=136370 RepID=A0A5M8PVM5_9LECA|nr:MAG: hypothetical protein FRX48_02028 [Lasallia pustulata]
MARRKCQLRLASCKRQKGLVFGVGLEISIQLGHEENRSRSVRLPTLVRKLLVDDVGTLGEHYSASLNDFGEYCHVGYKTDRRLKSDGAWDTYTKEWLSRYSKLVNDFHKPLKFSCSSKI